MNCLEARKYIYDFVQKNWEEEMVEDFLKHLHSCPECQEELRITHMVYHIVSETLVFWAVTFSLICFIAKYGVYLT